MKTKLFLILPLLALFTFFGCNEDDSVMDSQYKRENNFNKPGNMTIAQLAEGTLLAAAIEYVDPDGTGLGAAISNEDIQLTVFAPSDEAFVGLLAALEEAIENDPELEVPGGDGLQLTDIPVPIVSAVLQYHITNGRRASNSVVPPNDRNTKTIQTLLDGASFEVTNDLGILTAGGNDGAMIVAPNISASNGVIHGINQVLLPLTVDEVLDLLRPPMNP